MQKTASRLDLLKLIAQGMCDAPNIIILVNGVLTEEVKFELDGEDTSKIHFRVLGQSEKHQELIDPATFKQSMNEYSKSSSLQLLCKGGIKLFLTFAYVTGSIQDIANLEGRSEKDIEQFFASKNKPEEKKVKLFGIF